MSTIAEQLDDLPVRDDLQRAESPIKAPWELLQGYNNIGGVESNGYKATLAFGTGVELTAASAAKYMGLVLGTGTAALGLAVKAQVGVLTGTSRYFGINLRVNTWEYGVRAKFIETASGVWKLVLEQWTGEGNHSIKQEVAGVNVSAGGYVAMYTLGSTVFVMAKQKEGGFWVQVAQQNIAGWQITESIYNVVGGVDCAGNIGRYKNFAFGNIEPASSPRVAVNREFPPDQHCVIVRDSAGVPIARWAEDEGRVENVMNGLQLSGVVPGGRKELKVNLPRDPRVYWPDIQGFLNIECQQPGRNRIWDGRIGKAPRTDGDRQIISGEAVGWAAALEDRKGLRIGFIDADMTKWVDPSTARRLYLLENGYQLVASTMLGFSTLDPKATAPSIINDFTTVSAANAEKKEDGEAHYFSGGPDIGRVLYDYDQLSNFAASAEWESTMVLGTTDVFTTFFSGTNHQRTNVLQTQQSVDSPALGYKFARLRDALTGGAYTGGLGDVVAWQNLRVISRLALENLALQGAWPAVGYTAAQMLRYAVPAFSDLEVTADSIDDDGFVIQQAWFSDAGTLSAVVDELIKYGLYDWLVQDQRIFQLRAPGTYGRRWQAFQGPSSFEESGEDTDRLWDRITVAYQDVDGTTRYVGYVGSGAEVEAESLQITDPDHPAVKAKVTREDLLVIDSISTAARAINAGERWLQEANELSRSGKATLSGYAMDEFGVFRPVGQLAEGDLLRFNDARDTSYRKVASYDYVAEDRKVTVDLDAPSESVKALLERYRAVLTPLGFS